MIRFLVAACAITLLSLTGVGGATEEATAETARPAAAAQRQNSNAEGTMQNTDTSRRQPVQDANAISPKGSGQLTILEFGDLQCPDSAAFAAKGRQQLLSEFVSAGQAKYQFHDFPLDSHPLAARAAEIARCAGPNADKFRDRLLQTQMTWRSEQDLVAQAASAGIDQQCLAGGQHRAAVQQDRSLGQQYGVRATPTLVLGYTDAAGKFTPVKNVRGDQPYSVVRAAVQEALSNKQGEKLPARS